MSDTYIRNVVEAALLAAGRPLQIAELTQLFDEPTRPTNAAVRETLDALAAEYEGRGVELKETATGFRIQVRRELANEISRLWPERPPRYSRALLETLALIAYRQPITRAEIETVRGVTVNPNIIRTLIERNWVRVVGHRDIPGRPELLGTTREFLDYFGLKSLEELPPLAELKAMGDINLQLELAGGSAAAPMENPEGAAGAESPAAQSPESTETTPPAEAAEAVATPEVPEAVESGTDAEESSDIDSVSEGNENGNGEDDEPSGQSEGDAELVTASRRAVD